ncbi:hypothetical protein [Luteimonas sp. FCS-9]|uniref:CBU_0592 family membrane protein n=1 Tax=Luteimonas sp. FCS-9 TaxID=1547516 RepID=UPI00063EC1E3|nr:hypothetical protein [Luteimonas sp. FCS-9]KLJ01457.1 hypothetical protein WQ56_06840 [Luteimonas sp. FCS-9]
MDLLWHQWCGIVGATLIVLAYFLLQVTRLSGAGLPYLLLNLFGAIGVVLSLYGGFDATVLAMQLAWIAISLFGIARTLSARGRAAGPH